MYVIGLAPDIASESKLGSLDLFGQYGKIDKIVINTSNVYHSGRSGPSYSGYITFASPRDSALAILAVDQHIHADRLIRASFGTTKFCQYFLNGQKCQSKDCLFLHDLRADLEAYTKEDMQNNNLIFKEQQKMAIKLSQALTTQPEEFNARCLATNKTLQSAYGTVQKFESNHKPIFPRPDAIYDKRFYFMNETIRDRDTRHRQKIRA